MSSESASKPRSPSAPEVVGGRYRLTRLLGKGGMGEVYEATHDQTGRKVAVKLLRVIEAEDDEATRENRRRFSREARIMGQIRSPHVVEVLDADVSEDGASFMVMELLDGRDLDSYGRELGPLPPATVLEIGVQAAAGLASAHALGIVHRDVKPANLFVVNDGSERRVKVLDFGVAQLRTTSQADLTSQDLTTTGAFLGSPVYMSPEQIRQPKNVDARVDAWALCVTLYKLFCGRTPHVNDSGLGDLLITICSVPAPPLQRFAPWVPAEIAAVIERGLALSIEKRYRDIDELGAALRALASRSAHPGGLTAGDLRSLTDIERACRAAPLETSTMTAPLPSARPGARRNRTMAIVALTVVGLASSGVLLARSVKGRGAAANVTASSPVASSSEPAPASPPSMPATAPSATMPPTTMPSATASSATVPSAAASVTARPRAGAAPRARSTTTAPTASHSAPPEPLHL